MTAANTIQILQKATKLGLDLGVESGDTLTIQPANRCSVEFANTLKVHKPLLLPLVASKGKTWIEVYSQRLEETIYFCNDEETKAELVEAGASEWSVYTRDELQTLCHQNRLAPLTAEELRKLDEIKRTFKTTMTE